MSEHDLRTALMEETLGGHSEETNAPIAMDGDGGDLIDDVMLEGYEPPKRLVYTERRLREMQENLRRQKRCVEICDQYRLPLSKRSNWSEGAKTLDKQITHYKVKLREQERAQNDLLKRLDGGKSENSFMRRYKEQMEKGVVNPWKSNAWTDNSFFQIKSTKVFGPKGGGDVDSNAAP